MTDLAAVLIKDVCRWHTINGFQLPEPMLDVHEVLAALTAALDPALAERAGELLPDLQLSAADGDIDCKEAVSLITALLAQNAWLKANVEAGDLVNGLEKNRADAAEAKVEKLRAEAYSLNQSLEYQTDRAIAAEQQNAALRAERDELQRRCINAEAAILPLVDEREAAEAERDALRAERDAQRRDLEKTIRNQRAELRRLQALERVHWQSVERWKGTREGLEGKVKAAEAVAEKLRGALRIIGGNNCITCSAEAFNVLFAERHPPAALTTEADNG